MNIMDLVVFGIIIFCTVRGIIKGMVLSVFHAASFFIAAFGAAKFYPAVTNIILQTSFYKAVQQNIIEMILSNTPSGVNTAEAIAINVATGTEKTLNSVLDSLMLPENIMPMLQKINEFDIKSLINIEDIVENISKNISLVILNILSMIILFFAIKILLYITGELINHFMKLPILNAVNKLGGGIFGIVNGMIVVYTMFAICTLFVPAQIFSYVFQLINQSTVAKVFYNHNILLKLIF